MFKKPWSAYIYIYIYMCIYKYMYILITLALATAQNWVLSPFSGSCFSGRHFRTKCKGPLVLDWDSGLGVKGLSTVGHFFLFALPGQIFKCDSKAFADDLHVICNSL